MTRRALVILAGAVALPVVSAAAAVLVAITVAVLGAGIDGVWPGLLNSIATVGLIVAVALLIGACFYGGGEIAARWYDARRGGGR